MFKGTEEPTLGVDSAVPLTHHDPRDIGLIYLVEKRKICQFSDSFGFKNSILDFLKETHSQCLVLVKLRFVKLVY